MGSASWASMRLAEGIGRRTKPTAAGQGVWRQRREKRKSEGKENSQLSVFRSETMEGQAGRGRDESGLVRFLAGMDGGVVKHVVSQCRHLQCNGRRGASNWLAYRRFGP